MEREHETTAGISQMEWNGFKMVRKAMSILPLYSSSSRALERLEPLVVWNIFLTSSRTCDALGCDGVQLFHAENVKFYLQGKG